MTHLHAPILALTFLTSLFGHHDKDHKLYICHRDRDDFDFEEIDDRDWNSHQKQGDFIFGGNKDWHHKDKDEWCKHHHYPPSVPEFSTTTGLLAVALSGGAFFAFRSRFV